MICSPNNHYRLAARILERGTSAAQNLRNLGVHTEIDMIHVGVAMIPASRQPGWACRGIELGNMIVAVSEKS